MIFSNPSVYLRALINFVGSSFLARLRNFGDSGKNRIIMTAIIAGSDIIAVNILHPILLSTRRANPLDIASPEFQKIVITTIPAALKTKIRLFFDLSKQKVFRCRISDFCRSEAMKFRQTMKKIILIRH